MGLFFAYILKSAFCLVVFYLFYRLFLSRDTFHRFNRFALLSVLTLSWVIPLYPQLLALFRSARPEATADLAVVLPAVWIEEATNMPTDGLLPFWMPVILLLYTAGILFFVGRMIYSWGRMIYLLRLGPRRQIAPGIYLVTHQRDELAPFSWMRYVVISEQALGENGEEILAHEIAHIRSGHSFDILLADLSLFLQWFNPAAWLLKQELVDIHEYEADEAVLKRGIDAKKYQLLLIKKAVGSKLYTMANNFNHSKLKKRIAMMLKEKTNPWMRLKFLCVLPLAAVAVAALASPGVSQNLEKVSSVRMDDLFLSVASPTSAPEPQRVGDTTKVLVSRTVSVTGKDRSDVFYVRIDSTKAGSSKLLSVKTDSDSLQHTFSIRSSSGDLLCLIDGKKGDLKNIDQSNIESFSILRDSSAVSLYGEAGKNGVILITTKGSLTKRDTCFNVSSLTASDGKDTLVGVRLLTLDKLLDQGALSLNDGKLGLDKQLLDKGVLVLINGKETSAKELAKIKQDQVKSFSILKDESALKVYGEKGKSGVILITLKSKNDK